MSGITGGLDDITGGLDDRLAVVDGDDEFELGIERVALIRAAPGGGISQAEPPESREFNTWTPGRFVTSLVGQWSPILLLVILSFSGLEGGVTAPFSPL